MKLSEMAPSGCIVCGKPKDYVCQPKTNWIYLAGAKPLGAVVCSVKCELEAIERHKRTGRVDAPEERGSCKGCGLGIIVNAATRTVGHQDPLCEPFKAILAQSRGPVEQTIELRDGDGKIVRTPEGKV